VSVHKENGNWRVKWRASGKQRSQTFGSEEDARAFEASVRRRKETASERNALRWHANASDEQVYFVVGADKLKIGVSIDPALLRLADLQTGSPVSLSIAWRVTCPNARQLEAALHRRYAEHRSHGEWFDAAPILADILDLASLSAHDLEQALRLVIRESSAASGEPV
jgi:hypothetical protein